MLPVVTNNLHCEVPFRKLFIMPRVHHNQREVFDNDELFIQLSREGEVVYIGNKGREPEERRILFQNECRDGHADVAYLRSGINLPLSFLSNTWSERPEERIPTREFVDFEKEPGKVHLKSQFIMNGVCVVWKGWVDLHRLDGVGYMEFDSERAQVEETLRQQERHRQQIQQYQGHQLHRERPVDPEAEKLRRFAGPSPSISSGSSE